MQETESDSFSFVDNGKITKIQQTAFSVDVVPATVASTTFVVPVTGLKHPDTTYPAADVGTPLKVFVVLPGM